MVTQRGAQAGLGEAVSVAVREPFDESVQAQAAQIVAHAAAVVFVHGQADQRRHGLAQVVVLEAFGQVAKRDQGCQC